MFNGFCITILKSKKIIHKPESNETFPENNVMKEVNSTEHYSEQSVF